MWDWARSLATDIKADAVVFLGDRFKMKNSPNWMVTLADQKIQEMVDAGIRVALLNGNHDMMDKAGRWNTYGNIALWSDKSRVLIFDKPGEIDLNGIRLCFLPYGFPEYPMDGLDNKDDNILFFHNEVVGYSSYGSFTSTTGLTRESIDREEFSMVLGGHIHLRQSLDFSYVDYAGHIGSPLERLEDGNQGEKGAWEIDLPSRVMKFHESPLPKIKQWNLQIENLEDIPDISPYTNTVLEMCVNVPYDAPVRHWRRVISEQFRDAGNRALLLRMIPQKPKIALNTIAVKTTEPLIDQIVEYGNSLYPENSEIANTLRQIAIR